MTIQPLGIAEQCFYSCDLSTSLHSQGSDSIVRWVTDGEYESDAHSNLTNHDRPHPQYLATSVPARTPELNDGIDGIMLVADWELF